MEFSAFDFMQENPQSPISTSLFGSLPAEEQKAVIGQLIDGAVYCDAWEAYFHYARVTGIPVNDDVAFEAVQAVGLDPVSTGLWITAAKACSSDDTKRELFQTALSIPLYDRASLVRAYNAFEVALNPDFHFHDAHEAAVMAVVETERWPERYQELERYNDCIEVREQWIHLVDAMTANLDRGVIPADLQLRRMELAYRQMCVQLAPDDSCWYEFALFQLSMLEDTEGAAETIAAGLRACDGESCALKNLAAMMAVTPGSEAPDPACDGATATSQQQPELIIINERVAANRFAAAAQAGGAGRKESLKRLRAVGKAAAAAGVGDWKVYSEWSAIEGALVRDPSMAAKVLANGMTCCSESPRDATLLGNEAIRYHLIQRHEREALGYAEQQVEQASQSQHAGRRRAAWNTLVSTENQLGLSFSKAELRRGDEFPQSQMQTFLERCRVGSYLPCTSETLSWLQFVDDYDLEKRQEKEAPFKDVEAARNTVLCPDLHLTQLAEPEEVELIDETQWKPFTQPQNQFASAAKPTDDPDEVVGSRELRGRWAYRIKIDQQTEARVKREERLRKARAADEDPTTGDRAETQIGVLIQRTKALLLGDGQTQRLKTLSVDWIINQLVSSELDLREVLRARNLTQAQ